MNTRALLRILGLSIVSLALAATPQLAFARGGHGGGGAHFGGGGFHGGGFGGFGGGNVGAFRGGYGGFRGGFGGYRGYGFYGGRGYWGYPGWGLNIGLGFGYWGNPYLYGAWGPYGPYAYTSPDYPYYYDPYYDGDYRNRPDDRYPNQQRNGVPPNNQPNNQPGNSPNNAPPQPSSAPVPQGWRQNSVTTSYADYRTAPSNAAGNYTPVRYAESLPSNLRPAVRNVIEALRAMPPAARERQLNSGRYDGFSPEERGLVSEFTQTQ